MLYLHCRCLWWHGFIWRDTTNCVHICQIPRKPTPFCDSSGCILGSGSVERRLISLNETSATILTSAVSLGSRVALQTGKLICQARVASTALPARVARAAPILLHSRRPFFGAKPNLNILMLESAIVRAASWPFDGTNDSMFCSTNEAGTLPRLCTNDYYCLDDGDFQSSESSTSSAASLSPVSSPNNENIYSPSPVVRVVAAQNPLRQSRDHLHQENIFRLP